MHLYVHQHTCPCSRTSAFCTHLHTHTHTPTRALVRALKPTLHSLLVLAQVNCHAVVRGWLAMLEDESEGQLVNVPTMAEFLSQARVQGTSLTLGEVIDAGVDAKHKHAHAYEWVRGAWRRRSGWVQVKGGWKGREGAHPGSGGRVGVGAQMRGVARPRCRWRGGTGTPCKEPWVLGCYYWNS